MVCPVRCKYCGFVVVFDHGFLQDHTITMKTISMRGKHIQQTKLCPGSGKEITEPPEIHLGALRNNL